MKQNRKDGRLATVILQGLGAVFAVPILVLCIVRGAAEYGAAGVLAGLAFTLVMLVLFLAVLTLLFFGWWGYFSGDGLTAFGKIAAFAVLATLTAGFLFFTFKIVEWFLFSALSEVTIDRKTGWWSFRYLLFSRSKRLRPEAVVVKESGNADDCVWHASIRFKETSKEVPLAFGDGRTVDGFVRELETQFGRLLQEFELEIVFAD